MASDFHTHNHATVSRALISASTPLPGRFTSLEVHPWYLPDKYAAEILPEAKQLEKFSALGEIGLDKLRGTEFSIQQKYFDDLLTLAYESNKPVVIHCVKAIPELLSALKRFDKLRVMFHGFRASAELLDELWHHNLIVSFHPLALKKEELINRIKSASGAFGFESDDSDIDIFNLLNHISDITGIKNLEQITDQNFADFLEI